MFCPNCGKENPDKNQYCMECGTELIDNQNGGRSMKEVVSDVTETAGHSLKSWAPGALAAVKKHKKVLIPIAAAVVLVCAFAIIGSNVYSPERGAEKYFLGVVNADADAAYGCMSIEETPFTDKEAFDAYWGMTYAPQNIYNYTVSELEYGDEADGAALERTYVFDYYLNGESSARSQYVTVVNSGKKHLLFFDDYQVMPDFIARDYSISVIPGTRVTFDGVLLEGPYQDGDYDCYTIPALFLRSYDITLVNDLASPVTDTVYPSYSGDGYSCYEMYYSDGVCQQVYDLALSQTKSIINAAIAHSGLPGDIVLTPDSDAYASYSYLESRLYDPEDQTGYTSIGMTGATDNSSSQYFGTEYYYSCRINYDYKYSRNTIDWWTDEIETRTGESYGWATMEYYYSEDSGWMLYDFNIRY